ncbi:hypothetical protein BC831DRAFT_199965 [Entophlyctis helioformis]|nr:hypothetical protein BC831DRAFT_199965 [Entophlyctis helioformis]
MQGRSDDRTVARHITATIVAVQARQAVLRTCRACKTLVRIKPAVLLVARFFCDTCFQHTDLDKAYMLPMTLLWNSTLFSAVAMGDQVERLMGVSVHEYDEMAGLYPDFYGFVEHVLPSLLVCIELKPDSRANRPKNPDFDGSPDMFVQSLLPLFDHAPAASLYSAMLRGRDLDPSGSPSRKRVCRPNNKPGDER